MQRIGHILAVAIMLMLLLLGKCGVMVQRCECSGRASLVLPGEGDCCRSTHGCMTLVSAQPVDDYAAAEHVECPVAMQVALLPGYQSAWQPIQSQTMRLVGRAPSVGPPADEAGHFLVLRV